MMRKVMMLLVLSGLSLGLIAADYADYKAAMAAAQQASKASKWEEMQAAAEAALALAEKAEDKAYARQTAGVALSRQRKKEEAIAQFEGILAEPQVSADARARASYQLAHLYQQTGKADEAMKLWAELAAGKQVHQSAMAHLQLAQMALVAKDYDAANSHAQAVLTNAKARPEWKGAAILLLGNVELAKGNAEKAFAHYQQARQLEKAGLAAAALQQMGNAHLQLKQYEAARERYNELIAYEGKDKRDLMSGQAQLGIAQCYEAEGNKDEAVKAYQILLEMPKINAGQKKRAEARIKHLTKPAKPKTPAKPAK